MVDNSEAEWNAIKYVFTSTESIQEEQKEECNKAITNLKAFSVWKITHFHAWFTPRLNMKENWAKFYQQDQMEIVVNSNNGIVEKPRF